MRTDLVQEAFLQAVFRKGLNPGLIVHSDCGSQYAGHQFRKLLEIHRDRLFYYQYGHLKKLFCRQLLVFKYASSAKSMGH